MDYIAQFRVTNPHQSHFYLLVVFNCFGVDLRTICAFYMRIMRILYAQSLKLSSNGN